MKRLKWAAVITLAAAVPVAVAAVDAPFLGIIIASTSGARNQADTATPFTIPQGACVMVDCVNDAGSAANAFVKWTNAWTDAGSVTRQNWTWMGSSLDYTCGGSGSGSPYQVLSVMGNTEPVFCHVTQVGP